jgi:hypothetical protein
VIKWVVVGGVLLVGGLYVVSKANIVAARPAGPITIQAPGGGTEEVDSASEVESYVDQGPLTVAEQANAGNVLAIIAQTDVGRATKL